MTDNPRERILRRVLRLVDISRDLDRNRSDSDFTNHGGRIIKVLDQNIFEMFFRPYRHTESVQTFYDVLWSDQPKVSSEWRSIEAQCALLTAESLIERSCREVASGHITLTEQHRFELAKRVEELADEIRTAVDSSKKSYRKELETKMAVMRDLEHGRVDVAKDFARDLEHGALGADLEALREEASNEVVERFRSARVAAAFLATDDVIEPLEQLSRAVTHPIRSALRTAQLVYPVVGTERASIEADADRWYERLVAELRRPAHRHRLRAKAQQRRELASDGSDSGDHNVAVEIRNDARSIAYLRWIVRNRLKRGERLVFVTGDLVVFDAYRRWYLGRDPAILSGDEPFFLRRAVQYSPMFNPVDSGSDLYDPEGEEPKALLFNLIQQAVEASIIHLPRGEDGSFSDLTDPCFNASREKLALKLVDCEDLLEDQELTELSHLFTDNWLAERSDELERITGNWQRAQRFSIGASFELVRQRLGGKLKEASEQYFGATAQEATPILSRYISGVLDQLIEDGLQLWLPIAEAFNVDQHDAGPGRRHLKRISIALDDDLRLGAAERDGRPTPAAVFAAAAVRALEHQDVVAGARFASLAGRADKVTQARGAAQEGREFEVQYLQAVALRLQILSVDSHLRSRSKSVRHVERVQRGALIVKNLHWKASSLIEHCIAAHSAQRDDAKGDALVSASVRLLRGLSERASLNLFTATSFGLASRHSDSPLLMDWERHLEVARGDLKRCLRLDEELEGSHPILDAVRAQFIPNVAAYEVLAHVLTPGRPPELQNWPRRDIRRLWDFWGANRNIHPLLRTELVGYSMLAGETPPQGASVQTRSHLKDHRELTLPLDRILYRTIHRELGIPRGKTASNR